ncbi:hypothetical protein [Syntrophotalea acetylenica]|uniref:hypothetical protein n=1 Tax=Syntrophotalea acetylenica TaxID=29542 RepID=UPI002A36386E|nr:hypothetical protein [Syntrophotalea acetylenica]MDY0262714.1 hypothetical protein [Syntrophotalea acetylenica]
MTREEINGSLVRNAFDFLEKAIADFPESPKFSVIHFYAAVELILKSRLLQEHWALVVSKPQEADWDKFLTGNFHSVGLREANNRLKSIAKDGLGKAAFAAFVTLSNHRNRLMHFFHPGISDSPEQLETIVAEQSIAWLHLHDLLTQQWHRFFGEWGREIRALDFAMKRHSAFLQVKFEKMQPEIDEEKAHGIEFVECSACGFEAARRTHLLGRVSKETCLVCDYSPEVLDLECPDCGNLVKLVGEGRGDCENCERKFDPEDLAGILIDDGAAHIAAMDGDDRYEPANCGFCDGYNTVIYYEGNYLCINCLDLSESLHQCEWCHEGNTGDMENSYFAGCNQCDGRSGWERDD